MEDINGEMKADNRGDLYEARVIKSKKIEDDVQFIYNAFIHKKNKNGTKFPNICTAFRIFETTSNLRP